MLDVQNNFAVFEAVGTYSSSDIAITVTALGNQSALQTPCNLVWYNHTDFPSNPSQDPNREIVRAISSVGTPPTLITVTRGQESIVATAKDIAGKVYRLVNVLTAKNIDDIATDIAAAGGAGDVEYASFSPLAIGWTFNLPSVQKHITLNLSKGYYNPAETEFDLEGTIVFPPALFVFEGQKITINSTDIVNFLTDTNGVLGPDVDGLQIQNLRDSSVSFSFDGVQWIRDLLAGEHSNLIDQTVITLVGGAGTNVVSNLVITKKRTVIQYEPTGPPLSWTINIDLAGFVYSAEISIRPRSNIPVFAISGVGLIPTPFSGAPTSLVANETTVFKKLNIEPLQSDVWERIIYSPQSGAAALPPVNLTFDPPFSAWSFPIPDTLALRTILRIEASDPTVLGGTITFPSLASLQEGQEVEIHTATQTTYNVNFNGASGDTALQDQYAQTSVAYRHSGGVWRKASVSSRRSATLFSFLAGPAALFVLPDPVLPLTEGIDQPSTPDLAIQLNGTGIASCNVNFSTNGDKYIVGTKITLIANTDISLLTFTGLTSFVGFPAKLLAGESFTMRKTEKVPQKWVRTDNTSPAVLPLLEFMSRGRWMAKNAILVASLTDVDFGVVAGTPTLVACGTNTIIRSVDMGENWTAVTAPTGVWSGIAFKAGRFCLVENNLTAGTNQCAVSDDGGQTWTTGLTGSLGNWKVVAGTGNFIASTTGNNPATSVITSADGLAPWTVRKIAVQNMEDIVYDPVTARVFRVGFIQATVPIDFSINDGITWTDAGPVLTGQNRRIAVPVSGGVLLFGTPSAPSGTNGDITILTDPLITLGGVAIQRSMGNAQIAAISSRSISDMINVGGTLVSVGAGLEGSAISFDQGNNWSGLQVAHAGPWIAMTSFQMPSGRHRVVAVAGGTTVSGQSSRVMTLDL